MSGAAFWETEFFVRFFSGSSKKKFARFIGRRYSRHQKKDMVSS